MKYTEIITVKKKNVIITAKIDFNLILLLKKLIYIYIHT